ncbi:MAG: 2-amino-4-hydroxy-6-hydroxymethyldihydropteridine diphosphokinase [Perlucidibaca sp.]
MRAAIGLGGNLGDAPATLLRALAQLDAHPGITLRGCSPLYRSVAIGPSGQPDYANAVACLETSLSPHELLDALQLIEHSEGRVRHLRWGARTLDLDLLLFGDQLIHDPRLTVPHAEMTARNFVLRPLADIAPDWLLPDGRRIAELAASLPDDGLSRWPDPRWPFSDGILT